MNVFSPIRSETWLSADSCSIKDFAKDVEQGAKRDEFPFAAAIEKNIPLYDAARIRECLSDEAAVAGFMAEWNTVFLDGPGVLVFKCAYQDPAVVDRVTEILNGIIEEERASKANRGDHFGKPGANARVWNAHEKLCVKSPEAFAWYNANDIISLISRAWLGPLYQITAQVNLVYPGGKAQTPHRDYHMGFQTDEQLKQYPAHVHRLSAALTLQGAIAHCDMPIESGPTKLLPFSQRYLPGYFAINTAEFRDYFEEHHVQLPLEKGDALFFNPALFHAAGTNSSKDIARFANLLQIGSGYGRSIEAVDRARMSKAIFPVLKDMAARAELNESEVENVIAAAAEGYPFPANLDLDSPLSGLAPASQQDLMRQALAEGWTHERFSAEIDAYIDRRRTH